MFEIVDCETPHSLASRYSDQPRSSIIRRIRSWVLIDITTMSIL